jgi:hypothetical protein
MPLAPARIRPIFAALVFALLVGLLLASSAGATGSISAASPGETFGRAIERARAKRASKLNACAGKPTEAARDACASGAESAFTTVLEKAQQRRAEERSAMAG